MVGVGWRRVVRALRRFPQPHSGKPPHKLLSGNLRPQTAFHGFLGGSARAGAPSGACTPSPSPPTATAQFSTFLGFQPCDPCPQLPPSHMRGCFPHLLAHFCARRAQNHEPHAPPTPPRPNQLRGTHAPWERVVRHVISDQMREMQPGRCPPRHPSPTTSRSMHDMVFCEGNGWKAGEPFAEWMG